MKKLQKTNTKSEWIGFDKDDQDVQFLIKPFSMFAMNVMPSDSDNFKISEYWSIFNYVVSDWKGIVGDDDKPLPCNKENKRLFFDCDQATVSEIVQKCTDLKNATITPIEEKN